MATKTLKYAFAIFLTLALIVLLRAYLHQPDAYQAEISEPIIFDETKSINNLSRSIQFETISHPDYEKFDYDEFQRFLSWIYSFSGYCLYNSCHSERRTFHFIPIFFW